MSDTFLKDVSNLVDNIIDKLDLSGPGTPELQALQQLIYTQQTAVANKGNVPVDRTYELVCEYTDSRYETVGDFSTSFTQLQNMFFIQPLAPLTIDEFEALHTAVEESTVDMKGKGLNYIIVPYDVKIMRVRGIKQDKI